MRAQVKADTIRFAWKQPLDKSTKHHAYMTKLRDETVEGKHTTVPDEDGIERFLYYGMVEVLGKPFTQFSNEVLTPYDVERKRKK